MADPGIINQAIANQFDVTVDCVSSMVTARDNLESFEASAPLRKNLTLGDKLRALHLMDIHNNKSLVGRICKIDRKSVRNILSRREKLLSDEMRGIPIHVKRPLFAEHPDIEADVIKFIKFVRSERLPVTSCHIKARALRAARNYNHTKFRASNGCLQKFIRRSAIQKSFKLHGKGGMELTTEASARMQEIRDISSQYELKNIYNMDESGLFFFGWALDKLI